MIAIRDVFRFAIDLSRKVSARIPLKLVDRSSRKIEIPSACSSIAPWKECCLRSNRDKGPLEDTYMGLGGSRVFLSFYTTPWSCLAHSQLGSYDWEVVLLQPVFRRTIPVKGS